MDEQGMKDGMKYLSSTCGTGLVGSLLAGAVVLSSSCCHVPYAIPIKQHIPPGVLTRYLVCLYRNFGICFCPQMDVLY